MISVSVVSHAQNALINQMLASLTEFESDLSLEILITENIHDEIALTTEAPGFVIRILRNQSPQGFARNHNIAFREARYDYFCITNPDVQWIEPIFKPLQHLIERREADVVAPSVVDYDGLLEDSFRNLPSPFELFQRRFLHRKGHPLPHVPGEIVHPDWIAGIFMFMRSDVFSRLGGFDDRYYLYFEDVDFCSRARMSGLKIGVDTGVRVVHKAPRRSWRINKYFFWHSLSAARFFTSSVYREVRKLPLD